MVDATTVNLTAPANGAWDVPVNNNAKAIDGYLGGFVRVGQSSANMTAHRLPDVWMPRSRRRDGAAIPCTICSASRKDGRAPG